MRDQTMLKDLQVAHKIIANIMYRKDVVTSYEMRLELVKKLISRVFFNKYWNELLGDFVFENGLDSDPLTSAYGGLGTIRYFLNEPSQMRLIQASSELVSCVSNLAKHFLLPPQMVIADMIALEKKVFINLTK